MSISRRQFCSHAVAATAAASLTTSSVRAETAADPSAAAAATPSPSPPIPSGDSATIASCRSRQCIDEPARMGFDGVEILHCQMDGREPRLSPAAQAAAPSSTASTCAASRTHQRFRLARQGRAAEEHRPHDPAASSSPTQLGIPTMRVNTGRWGTIKDFDELMANRGIEPQLQGYTDDDGFNWVIDCFEKCLPAAESAA